MRMIRAYDPGRYDRIEPFLDKRSGACYAKPCVRSSGRDKGNKERGEDFGYHG